MFDHPKENSHLYHLHEMQYAAIAPIRAFMTFCKEANRNPFNAMAYTPMGKKFAAACEVGERITHRYDKPEFNIPHTLVNGKQVTVYEELELEKPFCRLLHFKKYGNIKQPKMLIVAPMSGHHATLLRGTVEVLLPDLDVYITDWIDARYVPMFHGEFHLEDYVTYLMEFVRHIGDGVHTLAVCQPSVPMLIAASIMNQNKDPQAPLSMTLIGGPIDTRINPTKVNSLAENKPLSWFESNVITRVPVNYPGFMRRVYPGFLQLSGFMQLNLDRHINAHKDLFKHLIEGDGESAAAHRKFYDEYLAVADLPAEFYLECIDMVFQRHALPKGEFTYKGQKVKPQAITKTGLLTLEGELDDISGVGQTKAAHALCTGLPANKRYHHMQAGVGHYGIFNGRKFRDLVAPIIVEFVREMEKNTTTKLKAL